MEILKKKWQLLLLSNIKEYELMNILEVLVNLFIRKKIKLIIKLLKFKWKGFCLLRSSVFDLYDC